MSLAVLTDDQIKGLLENLTLDELESFRDSLKSALHEYSTGTQSAQDNEIHQPHRTTIKSGMTGASTLFMPSSSMGGMGIKVVTLTGAPENSKPTPDTSDTDNPNTPVHAPIKPTGAITLFSKTGAPLGLLHASTLTAFRTALASACLLARRNTVRTLTVFGAGEQAYWHVRLALMLRGSSIKQVNIINHRFSDACKHVMKRFFATPSSIKEREGWASCEFGILTPGYGEFGRLLKEQMRAADVIFCCTPSAEPLFDASILTSHEGRRKGRLVVAVGSYTPGMRELPVEILQQATKKHASGHYHFHKHAVEGGVVIVDTLDGALKEAGEIIEAGLSPTQLVELGELVMLHRIRMKEEEEILPEDSASVISASSEFDRIDLNSLGSTDSPAMSSVFSSAGTGTGDSQTTLSRTSTSSDRTSSPSRSKNSIASAFRHRRSSSQGSTDRSLRKKEKDDHLARWLQAGNVIYKSVGLGLMDLTVGLHLIQFAKEKGVGSHIEGF